jgi:hypothetical protein
MLQYLASFLNQRDRAGARIGDAGERGCRSQLT